MAGHSQPRCPQLTRGTTAKAVRGDSVLVGLGEEAVGFLFGLESCFGSVHVLRYSGLVLLAVLGGAHTLGLGLPVLARAVTLSPVGGVREKRLQDTGVSPSTSPKGPEACEGSSGVLADTPWRAGFCA